MPGVVCSRFPSGVVNGEEDPLGNGRGSSSLTGWLSTNVAPVEIPSERPLLEFLDERDGPLLGGK